jgi:hypothetical protein
MEEGDVKVGVIRQQMRDVVALAPNGNIEAEIQAKVHIKETSTTVNVNRIEVELQKTIDMIEDQEIVALGQENVNGDVDPHAQIDRHEILYFTYYNYLPNPSSLVERMVGFSFVKFVIAIPFLIVVFKKPLLTPPSFSMEKVGGEFVFGQSLYTIPLGFV